MLLSFSLLVAVQVASTWGQYACDSFGVVCIDCMTIGICSDAGLNATELPCQTGQLCGVSGAFASCFASTATETATCQCPSSGNFLKDPYDPQTFYLCLPDGTQIKTSCAVGEVFDDENNVCVPEPTPETPLMCTAGQIGFVFVTCTSYYACSGSTSGSEVFDCPEGQYFYEAKGLCVPPEELGGGSFSCGAEDGVFGDPVDCSVFYICSGGSQLGNPLSCPDGQIFLDGICQTGNCTSSVSACATSISLASTTPMGSTTPISSTASSASSTASSSSTGSSASSSTGSSASSSTGSSASSSTGSSASSSTGSSASSSTGSSVSSSTGSSASSSTGSSASSSTASSTSSSSVESTSSSTTSSPTTQSTTTPSTTTARPDCTSSNAGLSAVYPGDCKQYYFCQNGEWSVLTCTGSLLYSPSLNYCTLPENVPECA